MLFSFQISLPLTKLITAQPTFHSYAAQEVLKAATLNIIPLIEIPMDITLKYGVPFDEMMPLQSEKNHILQNFISALLVRPRKVYATLGLADELHMHDPLAAWFTIQHAETDDLKVDRGWSIVRRTFLIERKGEWTKGMCVVDRRCVTITNTLFRAHAHNHSILPVESDSGTTEDQGVNRSKSGIETASQSKTSPASSPTVTVDVLSTGPTNAVFSEVLLSRLLWHRNSVV